MNLKYKTNSNPLTEHLHKSQCIWHQLQTGHCSQQWTSNDPFTMVTARRHVQYGYKCQRAKKCDNKILHSVFKSLECSQSSADCWLHPRV